MLRIPVSRYRAYSLREKNKADETVCLVFKKRFALDSALDLAGTETTGTYVNRLRGSVNNSLHLSDVGLPGSVGLAVRVRNVVTEGHALVAYAALCHVNCTS